MSMKKIHPIAIIMLAVLAWGVFHAVGAFGYQEATFNWRVARPLVVIGCSLGFLGFWLLMLQSRRRRLEREKSRHDA